MMFSRAPSDETLLIFCYLIEGKNIFFFETLDVLFRHSLLESMWGN